MEVEKDLKKTLKTEESFILNWMKHFLKARNYRATPMDLLTFGLALLGLFVWGRSSTPVSTSEVLNSSWRN